ncbi:suppressor of yeast profilin deletion [[Candida] anglica]|uniref:Suppressor of yeast profilin deletion n=1 Tax=[Candida] anglica TaxID=148631 RepID=A0ABP0EIC9_9ASCO
MSDSKYGFGTAILTSKTPQEAAAILPHTLNTSKSLVQKNLITWFTSYTQELQRHNHELGKLLNEGAGILGLPANSASSSNGHQKPSNTPEDLGSFNKIWNTFLRSIELELHSNEQYFKNIKLETLGPLKDFTNNDVRYSELVLNSQELQEISRDLGKNDSAEYQWNVKAPQIFDNLENFEKVKSQLLFDVILNYFNSQNTRFSKLIGNSENSVNYLLGTYKLDEEMNIYLKYLLGSDFTSELSPVAPTPVGAPVGSSHQNSHFPHSKRLSSFGGRSHSDVASTHSSSSSNSKKPSKLKSKVGSIFGRKNKKASKLDKSDTIPESESVTSSTIATPHATNRSTDSLGNILNSDKRKSGTFGKKNADKPHPPHPEQAKVKEHALPLPPATVPPHSNDHYQQQQQQQPPPPPQQQQQPPKHVQQQQLSNPSPFQESAPAQQRNIEVPPKSQKTLSSDAVPLTPRPKDQQFSQIPTDSPNVIKYDASSSPSLASSSEVVGAQDSPVKQNKHVSLLQKHDLHVPSENVFAVSPPITHNDHLTTSTTSASKFSFEAGDDEKPISATPKEQQANVFESNSELPEPDFGAENNSPYKSNEAAPHIAFNGNSHQDFPSNSHSEQVSGRQSSHVAPPPPPARKVAHASTRDDQSITSEVSSVGGGRSRKDVKSMFFHNLPATRDSVIAPRTLASQDTGNSVLKHLNGGSDIFKHSQEQNEIGLNASIAEVINASFKDDKVIRHQLIGEVAFNYKPDEEGNSNLQPIPITIAAKFDKTIVNTQFITQNPESTSEYTIDPQSIISRTLGGLKYLKSIDAVPVLITQVWKFEDHQSSLLINMKLNPQYATSLTLDNVVISAALNPSVDTTSAASKPSGSFNKELNRITWRFPSPITLSSEKGETLIARYMTNGKGSEHESGIQLKFSIVDPPKTTEIFVNGSEVPSVRSLVSGSYSGHI